MGKRRAGYSSTACCFSARVAGRLPCKVLCRCVVKPLRIANVWLTPFYPVCRTKARHHAGEIDNPARSLLISTLSKFCFGPTQRSKLKIPDAPKKPNGFEQFKR